MRNQNKFGTEIPSNLLKPLAHAFVSIKNTKTATKKPKIKLPICLKEKLLISVKPKFSENLTFSAEEYSNLLIFSTLSSNFNL